MAEKTVVIQTKLGQLRGHTRQSILSNKKYFAFQGIPYAKPPIRELRFKAPQPVERWEGVRDALQDGNDPVQQRIFPKPGEDPNKVIDGDEDCLYLNICMNELPSKGIKKPVMFSIHGGGFFGGTGALSSNGPDFLLEGDVIFVSFSYRCGAFGFLSLETEEVPGNAGLKDQVMALKWVKDNIESFGGDPNNVTIFGISAGGASVDLLLLSPTAQGLFHQAIIQSGYSSNPWACHRDPTKPSKLLAKELGCDSENPTEIIKFLHSVSAEDIVLATNKLALNKVFSKNGGIIFSPCVEVVGKDPFLPDTPENLLSKGKFNKVPVILGNCQNEGSVFVFLLKVAKLSSEQMFSMPNEDPEYVVPAFLGLKHGSAESKEAAKEIWDFYLKGNPLSADNLREYTAYLSDVLFNIGMGTTRRALLEKSSAPVYTYVFTNHTNCMCAKFKAMFSGALDSVAKAFTEETCHGADCSYIYYMTQFGVPEITPAVREATVKHVKVWTTFARTGDPNCKELEATWDKDSASNPCYMDIGTTWTMRKGIPFEKRLEFWKRLCSKYSKS